MTTQTWDLPPRIKVLEALGCIGDARIEIKEDGTGAKVWSSTRNKYYDVDYDPATGSITSNDNGSFFRNYIGYPVIAFLMVTGKLSYDAALTDQLCGIPWKNMNQKFHHDQEGANKYILDHVTTRGGDAKELFNAADLILVSLKRLNVKRLKSDKKPPVGY